MNNLVVQIDDVARVMLEDGTWVDLKAPYLGVTKPGTRRLLLILEDTLTSLEHNTEVMLGVYVALLSNRFPQLVSCIVISLLICLQAVFIRSGLARYQE